MSLPARNTLAVVGAGPIGLEIAAAALDAGLDVHVFEQGEPGAHPRAWGHVRMFTPWRMNVGPASRARLEAAGWTMPPADECPTGHEYAERYLEPLAALPELKPRIHARSQVVAISRRGALKGDFVGDAAARRAHPFRLLVRDPGGRENFLHAFAAIDASGVYGQPNRAGDGGIPARNELYLAPQMHHAIPDVHDLQRATFAGKRTLVIGGGTSAATTVAALAALADEAPGTSVAWATRRPAAALFAPADDPLHERRALYERARALIGGAHPAVSHVGGVVVEGFEYNSATHRYRVTLVGGEGARVEESDQVVVHTGFGPDASLHRELQVHECWASLAPMKLAGALLGVSDCLGAPAGDADLLANPEPDFWILGHKSHGRGPHFLLEQGFAQAGMVVRHIAEGLAAPARG